MPVDDGPSPYAKLHGKEYEGLRVPFGAQVIYKATKRQQAKRMRFDPTGVYGIFVGFHLHPGYTHSKDYLVVDFDQLRDINLDRDCVTALRIRRVIVVDPIKFPFRGRRLAYIHSPRADIDRGNDGNDDDDNDIGSIHPDPSEEDPLGIEADAEYVHSMGSCSAMSEEEWRRECEDIFGEVDTDFQNPVTPLPGTRLPALRTALRSVPLTLRLSRGTTWDTERSVAQHDSTNTELEDTAVGLDKLKGRWFMAIPAHKIPVIAPAIRSGGANKRLTNQLLMEYSCGENPRLCKGRCNDKGCATVRLTIPNDLATPGGLDYAMQELERAHADRLNIALWVSLPCIAGTPWFRLNQKFASARAKNAVHLALFHKMLLAG